MHCRPKTFKRRLSANSPIRYISSIYGKLYGVGVIKGKQLPSEYVFYGGADWFTISEACVKELLSFVETHTDFKDLFINSLSGAEIYYLTLFEMLKSSRVVQNTNALRHIDWKERGQQRSAGALNTCSMDFVDEILASKAFLQKNLI